MSTNVVQMPSEYKSRISEHQAIDKADKKFLSVRPGAKDFAKFTIASVGTRSAQRAPRRQNVSAIPPATAPKPVAFSEEIPLNTLNVPAIKAVEGIVARTIPQMKNDFLRLSTVFLSSGVVAACMRVEIVIAKWASQGAG